MMSAEKKTGKTKGILARLLIPITTIVSTMAILILISIGVVFTNGYEKQIYTENEELASAVSGQVENFMKMAYNVSADLAENESMLSMENAKQTPILQSNIKRNDYFELLYIQGMDGMQTARSTGELGDRSNRWWFQQMAETKESFVSKSYYSLATKMPCASVFLPMVKNETMIGIFGADIKLDSIQELVEQYSVMEKGKYSFIIDGEGVVVAHPEKVYYEELYNYKNFTKTVAVKDENGEIKYDEQGNILTEEQPIEVSADYKKVMEDVMGGNSASVKIKSNGKTVYVSYKPITLQGASDAWSVITVQEAKNAMALRNQILMIAVLVSVILLVVGIVMMMAVAKKMIEPLQKITTCIGVVSEGDFTIRADETDKTEIGLLARKLNGLIEKLSSILSQTTSVAEDVANSKETLDDISESTNVVMNNMNSIIDGARQQQEETKKVTCVSEKMQNSFKQLDEKSKIMLKEADASIQMGEKGSEKVEHLQTKSKKTLEDIQHTVDGISLLKDETENIQSIVATITSISDETALLALNASIEAARAGDQGKGFAVVAEQISRLALSSNDATGDIVQIINEITGKVIETVEKADRIKEAFLGQMNFVSDVDKAFQEMNQKIQGMESSIREMNVLMEELKQLSEEIASASENVSHISSKTSDMSAASNERLEEEKEKLVMFMEKIDKLSDTSNQLKEDMEHFRM